jgi:putative acyl-CoA dehydrogenase
MTSDVANQPPPFEDINLYASDRIFREALLREGGDIHETRIRTFGARMGAAQTWQLAAAAQRNPPELRAFDRYGRRIDEVEYHPAYHAMMQQGVEAGISAAAWSGEKAGHVLHAALEFLLAEVEPSVCCPITMTYAAPAALKHAPELAAEWLPRIAAAKYDSSSQPAAGKRGVTLGMAMTEKQGGSDVRANITLAEPLDGGVYRLNGHKWFCSAPMSDAFLTLAQAPGGLACFLVPRWRPDGERNAIHLMRLKDKLGDRANASSEIEYHGAHAIRIGDE